MAERTGSWSKPLSRIVSTASAQGEFDSTVVTGLSRRDLIVAPPNSSFFESCAVRAGDEGLVAGGVGGRRLFAASQSSSTNWMEKLSNGSIWIFLASYF